MSSEAALMLQLKSRLTRVKSNGAKDDGKLLEDINESFRLISGLTEGVSWNVRFLAGQILASAPNLAMQEADSSPTIKILLGQLFGQEKNTSHLSATLIANPIETLSLVGGYISTRPQQLDLVVECMNGVLTALLAQLRASDPYPYLSIINRGLSCFAAERSVQSETLKLLDKERMLCALHIFWNSSYAGIPEICGGIYKRLLELDDRINGMDWVEYYRTKVPWYVKGKWRFLSILLTDKSKSLAMEVIDDLLAQIGLCFQFQHLSPIAASILCKFASSESQEVTERVTEMILSWSSSTDSRVRLNFSRNCARTLIKGSPSVVAEVISRLEQNISQSPEFDPISVATENFETLLESRNFYDHDLSWIWKPSHTALWAWTFLNRLRETQSVSETQEGLLRLAMEHPSNDIRIDAFQWLVTTPIVFSDHSLTLSFLDANMAVDDSQFRGRLISSFKSWIVRWVSRLPTDDWKQLAQSLFSLFIVNLFPGANFQRCVTALSLIQQLGQNSGITLTEMIPPTIGQNGFLNLLTQKAQHFASDVRVLSFSILESCFDLDDDTFERMFKVALYYCSSPKAVDCDIGSEWIRFLLLHRGSSCWPLFKEFSCDIESFVGEIHASISSVHRATRQFLNKLRTNFRDAVHSESSSLHGYLRMLKILSGLRKNADLSLDNDSFEICQESIETAMWGLGSEHQDDNPSFEKMGKALAEKLGTLEVTGSEKDVAIPIDEQLAMASCWYALKESASLLEVLGGITEELLPRSGELIYQMMVRLRHWGVLETCAASFRAFCEMCLKKERSEFFNIPSEYAAKALDQACSIGTVSITRRGVGIPMVLQSVIDAQVKFGRFKVSKSIRGILSRVLDYSRKLMKETSGKRIGEDLPVVRLLFSLRTLISSAGNEVLEFVEDACRLSIEGFVSDDWTIRNASVMLLASVVWRMFGRCEVESEGEYRKTGMSALEFIAIYPRIWTLFMETIMELDQLREAGNPMEKTFLKLYPLLSLLAHVDSFNEKFGKLTKHTEELGSARQCLNRLMFACSDQLLGRLIAQVLVSLTPFESRPSLMERLQHVVEQASALSSNQRVRISNLIAFLRNSNGKSSSSELELQRKLSQGVFGRNLLIGKAGRCFQLMELSKELLLDSLDETRLESWLCFLESCAKDNRCEGSRLAAAFSVTMLSRITFPSHHSKSSMTEKQMLRLLRILTCLLMDESSDIRAAAAQISLCLPQARNLSPPLLLKRIIQLSCEKINTEALLDAFSNEILVEIPLNTDTPKRFLFQDDDFSNFAEPLLPLKLLPMEKQRRSESILQRIRDLIQSVRGSTITGLVPTQRMQIYAGTLFFLAPESKELRYDVAQYFPAALTLIS